MEDYNTNQMAKSRRIRWSWLPSLFFGGGLLPSIIILAMIMLRRFGTSNAHIALYISLLCIPFALRTPLEMVVTYFCGTNKVWILSAEFISAICLWAIAFTLPTNYWLQGTMCFMPFVVTAGVLYDIAVERFYTCSNPPSERMRGIISTLFLFLAMLFGIGMVVMLAGNMEVVTRNVRYSRSLVFYIMAGMEFFLWLWHSIFLPGGKHSCTNVKDMFGLHRHDYDDAIGLIVNGWRNRFFIYFFLLFALPEAMMAIAIPLFVIDAPHNGGLGLSPQEFGLSYGTVAIIATAAGYNLGNWLVGRFGRRMCMLPMSIVVIIHGLSMVYLSYNQASPLVVACAAMSIGALALGIGISACSTTIHHFASSGRGYSLRRATAISLMSLTTVLAGGLSGIVLEDIGYRQFFTFSTAMYAVTVAIALIHTIIYKDAQ